MNSWPGRTTSWAPISPEATSTNSRRTSVGVSVGEGIGLADDGGPAGGARLGDAGADGVAPATGWTRNAAIVDPSGDHQKLTTDPSRSVRTLPDAGSITRSGPRGMTYAVGPGSVGPIDATVSPVGLNTTPAVPNTGIVRSFEPSRFATTT